MQKKRFHIIGIPHAISNDDYMSCAYTQKIRKLCRMLVKAGHEVIHYGNEGADVMASEIVDVATKEHLWQHYPLNQQAFFNFKTEDEFHQHYYRITTAEILKRYRDYDFILCMWGWGHQPIAKHFDGMKAIVVEPGVGYNDTFTYHRVFESYSHMHYVYGKSNQYNGVYQDCVIPNYFNPDDFSFTSDKQDYLLYFGRITQRKGVELAIQVAKATGHKIILAGNGDLVSKEEQLNIKVEPGVVEHVGYCGKEERRVLMANAKALLVFTQYIEPFGGVNVEAQLSGTPVISTDWGAFTETVLHGITGYRIRNFDQAVWAINNIQKINPVVCRQWAMDNYSEDRIIQMYEEYFQGLYDICTQQEGWYYVDPTRDNLDWLCKRYPQI